MEQKTVHLPQTYFSFSIHRICSRCVSRKLTVAPLPGEAQRLQKSKTKRNEIQTESNPEPQNNDPPRACEEHREGSGEHFVGAPGLTGEQGFGFC